MSEQLLAFHGQQKVKDKYLARVRAHVKADELVHGKYWENGKGCAVGCTIHSGNHAAYETELGVPRILARLEDGIFESLANGRAKGRAKEWPEQFLAAIPVGADLSLVWPQFTVWLLTDVKYGVLQFARTDAQRKAIQAVADGYATWVRIGSSLELDWWRLYRAAAAAADADAADAAAAAYAAAAYAAYAAAAAAAAYDADAAAADAAAAAAAADAAAADAADAAAYAAKRQEWRIAQADKLLELMAAAPVHGAVHV